MKVGFAAQSVVLPLPLFGFLVAEICLQFGSRGRGVCKLQTAETAAAAAAATATAAERLCVNIVCVDILQIISD